MSIIISTPSNDFSNTRISSAVVFHAAAHEKPDPVDEALGEAGAALKSVSFLPDAVVAGAHALTECFNFVSENFRSVALSVDAIRIGAGVFQDGGHINIHTARAAAGCVSGWMGACAGEIAGTHIGELVGGGLGGGLFATKFGEATVDKIIA